MHIDFPFGVGRSGQTRRTDNADHVRDLIEQLLFCAPGERVMRPEFGSGARHLVFEPSSDELAGATEFSVRGALQRYLGHLIEIEHVGVRSEDATLVIDVQYRSLATDRRHTEQFSSEI